MNFNIKTLNVYYNSEDVGTLKEVNNKIIFQYSEYWIKNGFSISPFSLPLNNSLYTSNKDCFEGVYGVFYENKDDHGNNFAFIYDEKEKSYRISPFYDITSTSYKLEHDMTVLGNGNPNESDLINIISIAKLSESIALEILNNIKSTINKFKNKRVQ